MTARDEVLHPEESRGGARRVEDLRELGARLAAGRQIRKRDALSAARHADEAHVRARQAHLAAATRHRRAAEAHERAAQVHQAARDTDYRAPDVALRKAQAE